MVNIGVSTQSVAPYDGKSIVLTGKVWGSDADGEPATAAGFNYAPSGTLFSLETSESATIPCRSHAMLATGNRLYISFWYDGTIAEMDSDMNILKEIIPSYQTGESWTNALNPISITYASSSSIGGGLQGGAYIYSVHAVNDLYRIFSIGVKNFKQSGNYHIYKNIAPATTLQIVSFDEYTGRVYTHAGYTIHGYVDVFSEGFTIVSGTNGEAGNIGKRAHTGCVDENYWYTVGPSGGGRGNFNRWEKDFSSVTTVNCPNATDDSCQDSNYVYFGREGFNQPTGIITVNKDTLEVHGITGNKTNGVSYGVFTYDDPINHFIYNMDTTQNEIWAYSHDPGSNDLQLHSITKISDIEAEKSINEGAVIDNYIYVTEWKTSDVESNLYRFNFSDVTNPYRSIILNDVSLQDEDTYECIIDDLNLLLPGGNINVYAKASSATWGWNIEPKLRCFVGSTRQIETTGTNDTGIHAINDTNKKVKTWSRAENLQ